MNDKEKRFLKFKCLELVVKNGSANARQEPTELAGKYFAFVAGTTPEKKEEDTEAPQNEETPKEPCERIPRLI